MNCTYLITLVLYIAYYIIYNFLFPLQISHSLPDKMTHSLAATATTDEITTTTESNYKMLSRPCLSASSPSTTTCPHSSSSSTSSSATSSSLLRIRNWNGNWNLSLLALIIASGCLMLNTPETAAFDIGEYRDKSLHCGK